MLCGLRRFISHVFINLPSLLQDGKTEEKSYRNDREKEQKVEEGVSERDPAGT